MAVSLGGAGGPGWARGQYSESCEMNVTPFVDVMLVLLIIFMVGAPIATVSIPVDLPPSTIESPAKEAEPVFISIAKNGGLYVMEEPVSLDLLASKVMQRVGNDRKERIYLRADEQILYRRVMEVMNLLQDAGFYKIGLVAEEVESIGS